MSYHPSPLDALKYAAAQSESTVSWTLDHIGGAASMTDALESEIEPAVDAINSLATSIRRVLAPHVESREDWFTYGDGRPVLTHLSVEEHSFTHLWHPDPRHEPPPPTTLKIPTGVDVPATRSITVSYELPSKMTISAGNEVLAQSGKGNAEVMEELRAQTNVENTQGLIDSEEYLNELAPGRASGLSPSVDQLKDYIAHVAERRESMPERLFDLRSKIIVARDESLRAEPWQMFVKDIRGFTSDGRPGGTLSLPNAEAKEMFGLRLALELAAEAGNESDVKETVNDYFSMIREPDQLMLVAFAALDSLATMVLPAMYDVVENKACDYDMRTNFASTALMTWKKRLSDFGSASSSGEIDHG